MQNICVLSPSVSGTVIEIPEAFQPLQKAIDDHEAWMAAADVLTFIQEYGDPEFVKYQLFLGTEEEWQNRSNIENVFKSIKNIPIEDPLPVYILEDSYEMEAIDAVTSFETLPNGLDKITEGSEWVNNNVLKFTCVESDDGASIILICGLTK